MDGKVLAGGFDRSYWFEDHNKHALPWASLSPEQQRLQATKMAIHAAMVDRMDQEIGRVFEQLRQMNAWENTLIVFLSDNGADATVMVRGDGHDRNAPPGSANSFLCLGPGWASASNAPFRRHKIWVHEGGIATPCILHWPARIRSGGKLRHTPAHIIDFVPTVLELAGVKAPDSWNGQSRPALPGKIAAEAETTETQLTRGQVSKPQWWQPHPWPQEPPSRSPGSGTRPSSSVLETYF